MRWQTSATGVDDAVAPERMRLREFTLRHLKSSYEHGYLSKGQARWWLKRSPWVWICTTVCLMTTVYGGFAWLMFAYGGVSGTVAGIGAGVAGAVTSSAAVRYVAKQRSVGRSFQDIAGSDPRDP